MSATPKTSRTEEIRPGRGNVIHPRFCWLRWRMLESALDAKWMCYLESSSYHISKLPKYVERNWKMQQSQYMWMSCGHKILGCIEQLRPAGLTVLMYFLGHLLDEFKAGDAKAAGSVSSFLHFFCILFRQALNIHEHPMLSVSETGYPTPNHFIQIISHFLLSMS